MSYRVIDPTKLKEKRGERSQDEIVEKANKAFSKSALCAWENGEWRPRPDKIPVLLNALGCSFEEISSPIEFQKAA